MSELKPIADIVVSKRYRQELGDIAALAESIRNIGMLQPIGLTPESELIFGERRLRAAQSLGWTEIAVTVIDLSSIAAGSYHENEMRKDFTVSERVAVMEAIRRRPIGSNQHKGGSEDLPTREQAAKRAGFGNTTTAREAIAIVQQGIPELVEAVDRGVIAIEPAFAIARQPPERQAEIISLPIMERRAAVRELDRPGKHVGSSKKPRASPIVLRPYSHPNWPTPEELELPPHGTPEYDAHLAKYGRTPLHPKRVTDLRDADASSSGLAEHVGFLNSDRWPDNADTFFEQINFLLSHVPQSEKTNGMETDFAAKARRTLAKLERELPKALALLLALDVKLKERKTDRAGQRQDHDSVLARVLSSQRCEDDSLRNEATLR